MAPVQVQQSRGEVPLREGAGTAAQAYSPSAPVLAGEVVVAEAGTLMVAVIIDPVVQLVAIGVLLVWVIALTVVTVRQRRQPWHDDGRPVFKKLPNGRIQFSWGVAQGLWQAERHHGQADSPSAGTMRNCQSPQRWREKDAPRGSRTTTPPPSRQ